MRGMCTASQGPALCFLPSGWRWLRAPGLGSDGASSHRARSPGTLCPCRPTGWSLFCGLVLWGRARCLRSPRQGRLWTLRREKKPHKQPLLHTQPWGHIRNFPAYEARTELGKEQEQRDSWAVTTRGSLCPPRLGGCLSLGCPRPVHVSTGPRPPCRAHPQHARQLPAQPLASGCSVRLVCSAPGGWVPSVTQRGHAARGQAMPAVSVAGPGPKPGAEM